MREMSGVAWKLFDAYDREQQLIDGDTGQILARVSGSRYQEAAGWTAWDCRTLPETWLGRYATESAAIDAALTSVLREGRTK